VGEVSSQWWKRFVEQWSVIGVKGCVKSKGSGDEKDHILYLCEMK